MISLARLVVIANQRPARTAQIQAIFDSVGPILRGAWDLPKHHLNQKLALGGPELKKKGGLSHMV
jgi:hypothetical protein